MKPNTVLVVAAVLIVLFGFVGGVIGYSLGQPHHRYQTVNVGSTMAYVIDERTGEVYVLAVGHVVAAGNLKDAKPLGEKP